jgi:hypothetical protein
LKKTIINKQLALEIVRKTGAVMRESSAAHDVYDFLHNNQKIASISIRHGSSRDAGHDYIPTDMGISKGFAREFARCNKDLDDLIEEMRNRGIVPR